MILSSVYLSRHDTEHALAVWIVDRPKMDEWQRITLDVGRVAQWPPTPRPLALLIAEHVPAGGPHTVHVVDMIASPAFAPAVAVVLVGALSRGLESALGAAPNVGLFDDVDDALEWLEAQRPEGVGPLRALWRETNLSRPPQRRTEQA